MDCSRMLEDEAKVSEGDLEGFHPWDYFVWSQCRLLVLHSNSK
jgi:hypothetical protein